jgi:TRAP-type C4-dicarboxylate transport system substrate-binding protein
MPAQSDIMRGFDWFGKEFEKRTDGRYKVEFYYSATLGKPDELVDLLSAGVIDFAWIAVGYTPQKFIQSRGFELAFMSENPFAWMKTVWEMYKTYGPIKDEWEKKNKIICAVPAGMDPVVFMTKKPVYKVDDLKGIRLRSYGMVGKMIKLLGGMPVALAFPEVYEALSRGVIDGATGFGYMNTWDSKFWEIAPNVINNGTGVYGLTSFGGSKKTYDELPLQDKKILDQLREDALVKYMQFMEESHKEITKKLLGKNINIINWSSENKKIARNICVPQIWEEWLAESRGKGFPTDEFFERYKTVLKKYESDPSCAYRDPFVYFKEMK